MVINSTNILIYLIIFSYSFSIVTSSGNCVNWMLVFIQHHCSILVLYFALAYFKLYFHLSLWEFSQLWNKNYLFHWLFWHMINIIGFSFSIFLFKLHFIILNKFIYFGIFILLMKYLFPLGFCVLLICLWIILGTYLYLRKSIKQN